MIYKLLLFTHSWLRWLVLILMLLSLITAVISLLQQTAFTKRHQRLFIIYRTSLGIEVLIGMLLYFIWSPFFTIKHPLAMFIAFIVCRTVEKKALNATNDRNKFRLWLLGNIAVLIIILLAIPWPFYEGFGRPWLR